MSIPLFQVDAFATAPFTGNPAAVCILKAPKGDDWMQNVAAEMNLSETAFLHRENEGWRLRWFTPAVEVDLCGHATLASAHILWEEGHAERDADIVFLTKSGELRTRRDGPQIEMDFPLVPEEKCPAPPGLLEALGTTATYVGRNRFDFLVQVDSEATLRSLKPDFHRLAQTEARGVIVTARSQTPEFDFISRFFAPAAGVDEDPVTGSAHCCLGAYWSKCLGKHEFKAYQASQRGGIVHVRVDGDRVHLGGGAVTVFRGWLNE